MSLFRPFYIGNDMHNVYILEEVYIRDKHHCVFFVPAAKICAV